ncbi:MAG: hypothetical protein UY89_C0006G0004 [Parcubacteria group bacterium GW2011_GWA1_54_9]|nr:MAG: hypothetical protein UY89_C0006G0004 [Parcubacteria group bacterium GW2011_GWA1_54_9]
MDMSSLKFPTWTEPAAYSFVVGAVVWWIALSYFGWVSAGTAREMATQKAQEAVVAVATPACVARFERQPNAASVWKKLNKTESWERNEMVEKAGWIAEPGQKLSYEVSRAISESCAEKILALKKFNGAKLGAK